MGMNLQDELPVISVLLTMIVLATARHPCAPYSDIVGHVDWRMDHREAKLSTFHLICSGGLHDKWLDGSDSVRILTLCGWSAESLDPQDILSKFPALQNLSVIDSNFTHLATIFPKTATNLLNVSFNGTQLDVLPENAFSGLPALRVLDLRHNALSYVNPDDLAGPSLEEIYLSDNPWKCVSEMSWILNLTTNSVASRVVDRDKMLCTSPYYNRPLLPVVEVIAELDKQCRQTVCSCVLSYVGRRTGGTGLERSLMAFASVNCSGRGLTEMPEFLPENTTALYLSNNQIHDLSPLTTNPVYKSVIDIYLDDNEIESISLLEGSDWLDHFRAFSVRGNRLADIPPYALENALQQNHHVARIYLGKNPWRCDCHFTPGFQELLRKHTNLIKDVHDIKCANVENDENSGKQIRDLTRTAICTSPDDGYWLQPLDILNAVLASLIFLVLGKLLYDYWTFKRTGKLPWIVAKIP